MSARYRPSIKGLRRPGYNRGAMTRASARRVAQRRSGVALARRVAPAYYGPRGAGESGYIDVPVAVYNMDTTGSIALINTVPQGAGTSQRVGKKIALKSLQCRGSWKNGTAAALNDVAMLIVYDKRPTGVLPAITDILVTANSRAFNNDTNSGRFRILKRIDKTMLGTPSTTGPDGAYNDGDWFLNLRGLPQTFKAAGTGAIGDIEDGAMYVVTVGSAVAGTTAALATLAFRLRYVDI